MHALLFGADQRWSFKSLRQVFLVLGSYISTSLIEKISKLDSHENGIKSFCPGTSLCLKLFGSWYMSPCQLLSTQVLGATVLIGSHSGKPPPAGFELSTSW